MCKCVCALKQGFSLLSSTLSNTMLFLLKSKGTAIYFFCSKTKKNKQTNKKKVGSGRSQEFYQTKATFSKWQHQTILSFFKSELILCNIFSPGYLYFFHFLFVGGGTTF